MSIKQRLGKLLIGKQNGKTLLERVVSRKDETPASPETQLYNPLQLAIRDLLELTFEEAGTYAVFKIAAYSTPIEGRVHHSAKYFLRDTTAIEEAELLLLEVIEDTQNQEPEHYLFHLLEDFEYDEEFIKLLEDDFFIISEETDEGKEIEKEYEKSYHTTSTIQVLGEDRRVQVSRAAIWNYELDDGMETSYLSIEIDADDGWITLYEGRQLLEGEFDIYHLSGDHG